jgi:hypothetical protein
MKLTCAELSQGRLETGAFNTSCSLGYLMAQDSARKAAAKLSLWPTAALLFGAFAASLAATRGGKVRDFNAGLTDG